MLRLTRALWELAAACDEAITGMHRTAPLNSACRLASARSHGSFQPRPTKGMLLAITVMFSTFASSGSAAI